MRKTAVGLFANSELADQAVRDLETACFARADVRVLSEPRYMAGADSSSTPRHDFQVSLLRDLEAIGATEAEAEVYVEGVRRGGALVFVSGPDERIDAASAIMHRGGPADVETLTGGEVHLPSTAGQGDTAARGRAIHAAVHVHVV